MRDGLSRLPLNDNGESNENERGSALRPALPHSFAPTSAVAWHFASRTMPIPDFSIHGVARLSRNLAARIDTSDDAGQTNVGNRGGPVRSAWRVADSERAIVRRKNESTKL
jgi:hypothetical protein